MDLSEEERGKLMKVMAKAKVLISEPASSISEPASSSKV